MFGNETDERGGAENARKPMAVTTESLMPGAKPGMLPAAEKAIGPCWKCLYRKRRSRKWLRPDRRPDPHRRRRYRHRDARISLRNSIATVFQDAGLLNRSIKDNIHLGRESATDAEVAEAAATDCIDSRLNGYLTQVGERGKPVGRRTPAHRHRPRCAKKAPILVLDEATSALDVETEGRVKGGRGCAAEKSHQPSSSPTACPPCATPIWCCSWIRAGSSKRAPNDELNQRGGRFTALLRTSGLLNDPEPDTIALPAPQKQPNHA